MKDYLKVANMAAASKLEINFRRLLDRCEAMASEIQDNKENVSWRLEKVGSIQRSSTVAAFGRANLKMPVFYLIMIDDH